MRPLALLYAALLLTGLSGSVRAGQAPTSPQVRSGDYAERLERARHYWTIGSRVRDSLAPPQWLADDESFLVWVASGPNAGTFQLVDAPSGRAEPLLAPAELQAQISAALGREAAIPPSLPFMLDAPRNRILFQAEGRAFAIDLGARRVTALDENDHAAKVVRNAALASPDWSRFAVRQPGGFSVVDAPGRTLVERRGEQDYGWQVPPGAWSPNGRHLAVVRTDNRNVHRTPIVEYRPLETVTMAPYPKTGTPLPRQELHIVDAASGAVREVPLGEEEGYRWLAGWRQDGREALLLFLSRDGKRLDLLGVDPAAATARLILREERPESFVGGLEFAAFNWPKQVRALEGNRGFLWISERDGWRHVYRYDWSGRLQRQLTRGRHVIDEVVGIAPGAREAFVLASSDGPAPYDRKLHRVDLRRGGMTRVTGEPGDHQVTVSPSGRHYSLAYSTFTQPRRSLVGAVSGRGSVQYAEADVSRLAGIGYSPPEPIVVLADDGATPLHGIIVKPSDFDPARRYPVINYVYSGPFTTIVPRGYVGGAPGGAMSNQAAAMAQMGFIVVMVDPRGTPGRGKAFQDVNYGRVGQTEIADQVAAIRQVAASRPYMDLSRVGIFGHSWGGYFAVRAMLTAPDFYKAGYAGAQGMLEESALINEPNLGLPSQNPRAYEIGSNVALAANLRGALKMMHGTSDVNATLSTTMRMAEALIRADRKFELLIMPGVPHGPAPPLDFYYFEDQMLFFRRHLGEPL